MSSVDVAADYARRLVSAEAHGSGDIEGAMHRLSERTGIGYWTLWGLWNRRRKTVDTGLLGRLREAYLTVCERQLARLQHDLATEQARCGDAAYEDLVREAEELVARLQEARKGRADR